MGFLGQSYAHFFLKAPQGPENKISKHQKQKQVAKQRRQKIQNSSSRPRSKISKYQEIQNSGSFKNIGPGGKKQEIKIYKKETSQNNAGKQSRTRAPGRGANYQHTKRMVRRCVCMCVLLLLRKRTGVRHVCMCRRLPTAQKKVRGDGMCACVGVSLLLKKDSGT